MRFLCSLCILLLSAASLHAKDVDTFKKETLDELKRLDQVISEKLIYRDCYIAQIDSLKQKAHLMPQAERTNLYQQIFRKYARFQTDSATSYLERIEQESLTPADTALHNYLCLSHAEIYAVTGVYSEAVECLHKVNTSALGNMKLEYYRQCHTLYGWMADYAVDATTQKKLRLLSQAYRDSILQIEPEGVSRDIILSSQFLTEERPIEALKILENCLKKVVGDDKVYIYYNIAQAYKMIGNRDKQVYYLTKTAKTDIKRGITEYAALAELAQILYESGDISRAYTYLTCSIEDAAFCKARLRAIEASDIFPIIDKTYKDHEKKHRRSERYFLYAMGVLSLLLLLAVFNLRRQMKKLSAIRKELAHANRQIKSAHDNLILVDRMKEEYIGRYLNRCRGYLETLDDYRRSLLKLAKAHQTEALLKQLNAETFITEERNKFYADFDKAFLNLFPHFIERFNELMPDDAKQHPKGSELLTTELRIFALIRLGVHDSSQIAHFLNYSLATIYNYRSKMRNKSVCGKDQFEEKIMNIS